MRKLVYLVAGARPNFMKIAPIIRAMEAQRDDPDGLSYQLIHTGQHYDREMSGVFFEELGIPQPDHHLECGSGSHAEQTAKVMVAFERVCLNARPDCVIVVGDVNSTLACSVVAKKLHIPLAHVEAGLRSGDRTMPEEINRLVTDSISDWFFCTEPAGVAHLLREGKPADAIYHVGHVMVDNLYYQRDKLLTTDCSGFESTALKQRLPKYGVVTMHRPSNVDDKTTLSGIAKAFKAISQAIPIIFPVHPRTRLNLEKFDLDLGPNVTLTRPLSYMEFLNLWKDATLVLTDSGGLQEETTALGIPCLTLRENTERPITADEGSNTIVGTDPALIEKEARNILSGKGKTGRIPELWDGNASYRIVTHLMALLR